MIFVLIMCGLLLLIILWLRVDFYLGRKKHLSLVSKMETGILHGHFEIFTHGRDFFRHYFHDLRQASKHIHVLYYIVRDDELGREFFTILKEKAKEGVEVRLLLDRIGSSEVKQPAIQTLRAAGVQFAFSNRIKFPYPFYSSQVRNHRKLTIIDGNIGYLGGFNIGQEYIDLDPKLSPWRDYQLRMTGESVNYLQSEFLVDWHEYGGENLHGKPAYFPEQPKGGVRHQFTPTEAGQLEGNFILLLQKADQSILIGTPYFIPSAAIFRELLEARQRGVEITIVVPFNPDHSLVQEASYRYLRKLLRVGARIYQYKNGFYHAKTILIDNKLCDIGTANFDMRSLFLNKEINCYIYDPAFIERVRGVIQRDILDSELLSLAALTKPNLPRTVKEGLAGALSYFL